ncbi:MAG: hypothetical protein Q8O25_12730 [Sulfurisoma sp.]|nr:hypothetical protein [Sulfurisoma sp.]
MLKIKEFAKKSLEATARFIVIMVVGGTAAMALILTNTLEIVRDPDAHLAPMLAAQAAQEAMLGETRRDMQRAREAAAAARENKGTSKPDSFL